MVSRNCSLPAPWIYRSLMHFSHIVSGPVYAITLLILCTEKSNMFKQYKYFLIFHTSVNIISELYLSLFMLPTTYLPHPMFRTTGFLADLGFSGILQFHIMVFMVMTVGFSVTEMFYFRSKVAIADFQHLKFIKFLKVHLLLFRFLFIIYPILAGATVKHSLQYQESTRKRLYYNFPELPSEVTCYSVIIFASEDLVLYIFSVIYGIMIYLAIVIAFSSFIYVLIFMKKSSCNSKSTYTMQKMLIISLFIQAIIHTVMVMVPSVFQVYALFIPFPHNNIATLLLLSVTYHGFFSTLAMIIFTKPLRHRILKCKKFGIRNNTVNFSQ